MTFIQTKCLFLGLAFLLVGLEAAPQGRDIQPPTDRAPSVVFNYGCQCTNLIYRDEDGKVDGNCESGDESGAQWCYVEAGSPCQDIQTTTQGPNWSYQACGTPSSSTELLYLGSTIIVELPSFTPFTSCPVDSYPVSASGAVTDVLNKRVLVCGGYNNGAGASPTPGDVYSTCYSLTGSSWKKEPGMLEKRVGAASSLWPGQGLLVTGGFNGNVRVSSTEYLSASGQWTPGPVLPVEMHSHCQVKAGSDVIITGGNVKSGRLASAYKITTDGTWNQVPTMENARYGHACLVHEGFLYVIGGVGADTSVEKIKLGTLTWETGPGLNKGFAYGQAILYQDTIFLVYKGGQVVKLNTEDKWEDVADLGGSIGSRPVFPAPILTRAAIGC